MRLIITTISILIGVLIYCFFNYQFWNHIKTSNLNYLFEYQSDNIKGLRGNQILIHKEFEKHLERINNHAEDSGIILSINQSYRPSDAFLKRTVVRPAKHSNHLAGFAIDFNVLLNGKKYFAKDLKRENLKKLPIEIQNFINKIRKDKHLRWGGDFDKQDPVHIDHPLNHNDPSSWQKKYEECNEDFQNKIPIWMFWK